MKVLVTGGAGFIGSHVCERLLREGHAITIVDQMDDFYPSELKRQNLQEIRVSGEPNVHEIDICDREAVCEVFSAFRPDVIIHFAARVGVRPSLTQPFLYERTNVFGTLVLLEAAREFKVPTFIFASSSSIYGIVNRVPFREDESVNLPVSIYAATKIAGEKLCYTYSHLYGLRVVCLRFFTVYGPRQRPDLAIRKFVQMIGAGAPIPVFGDGGSGRDYTYVEDVVEGILAVLSFDCRFDIFNLGSSRPITVRAMIATIEGILRRKAQIEWLPDQPGDVPITCADISKARRLLGYEPRTPFPEGVAKFIAWLHAVG